MRLNCALHGHLWRETSGPSGLYQRCRRCCTERDHSHGFVAG